MPVTIPFPIDVVGLLKMVVFTMGKTIGPLVGCFFVFHVIRLGLRWAYVSFYPSERTYSLSYVVDDDGNGEFYKVYSDVTYLSYNQRF